MAQRRRERHAPEPGGGADEGLEGVEDESAVARSGMERAGEAARVGGIGEVPRPPGEHITVEEGGRGEGGARDNLITAMAGMEVGGEDMDEGEEAEVEQDTADSEEGGSEDGGCWHCKKQGS